jgi:hypothetical protein
MNSGNRKSTRRYWICGGGILLTGIVITFLFQLFGPNPPIVISPATTVITEPLGDDGLPDYQKHWLELGREGVTHENNGAVLFWQAVWPGELSPEDRLPMSKILGFEQEPDSTAALQAPFSTVVREQVARWLTEQYQQGLSDQELEVLASPENQKIILEQTAEEVIDRAMSRPWTSAQVPPLAAWVTRNEKPLSLLIEASQRPRWWSPSPSLLDGNWAGGVALLLPDIQVTRDVARAFNLRAMWHVGEGRFPEAWSDLKANFRLARVTGEGPTLIGQIVAVAIDGITLHQTIALLQQEELDTAFARQVLRDLQAMEKPCDIVRSIDEHERILFADMAILMACDPRQIAGLDYHGTSSPLATLANFRIDWNHILREGNLWYDRLVEAVRKPTHEERRAALKEFDEALPQVTSTNQSPLRIAASFLNSNARSALIADVMVSLFLSGQGTAMNAEDRAVTMLDLTRTAAALAVYRAEQGEYPETLDQLVPGVLAKVPDDLYSGKPFIYRRMPDGGYLLYSVYENEVDDGGTNVGGQIIKGEWGVEEDEDFDYENTDLVIRVPMPKFELPSKLEFVE